MAITELQICAKKKQGKCLSKEYEGARFKYLWQCRKKHTWKALWSNVRRGNWCPYCTGTVRNNIKKYQEIAKRRKGKCKSKRYVNLRTKLAFEYRKCAYLESRKGLHVYQENILITGQN